MVMRSVPFLNDARLGTLYATEEDRVGWTVTQGASGFSRQ